MFLNVPSAKATAKKGERGNEKSQKHTFGVRDSKQTNMSEKVFQDNGFRWSWSSFFLSFPGFNQNECNEARKDLKYCNCSMQQGITRQYMRTLTNTTQEMRTNLLHYYCWRYRCCLLYLSHRLVLTVRFQ